MNTVSSRSFEVNLLMRSDFGPVVLHTYDTLYLLYWFYRF